jgi:hypothetical protein
LSADLFTSLTELVGPALTLLAGDLEVELKSVTAPAELVEFTVARLVAFFELTDVPDAIGELGTGQLKGLGEISELAAGDAKFFLQLIYQADLLLLTTVVIAHFGLQRVSALLLPLNLLLPYLQRPLGVRQCGPDRLELGPHPVLLVLSLFHPRQMSACLGLQLRHPVTGLDPLCPRILKLDTQLPCLGKEPLDSGYRLSTARVGFFAFSSVLRYPMIGLLKPLFQLGNAAIALEQLRLQHAVATSSLAGDRIGSFPSILSLGELGAKRFSDLPFYLQQIVLTADPLLQLAHTNAGDLQISTRAHRDQLSRILLVSSIDQLVGYAALERRKIPQVGLGLLSDHPEVLQFTAKIFNLIVIALKGLPQIRLGSCPHLQLGPNLDDLAKKLVAFPTDEVGRSEVLMQALKTTLHLKIREEVLFVGFGLQRGRNGDVAGGDRTIHPRRNLARSDTRGRSG